MRENMTAAEVKTEARNRRLGPDGRTGPTSWIVSAPREKVLAALEAADSGNYLAPAETTQTAGSVLDALIREALERPSGVDEETVREIVRAEVRSASVSVQYVNRSGAVHYSGRQHPRFADLLAFASDAVPCILVGEKGSGKSEAAKAVADALGIPFRPDSFSFDSGRHDVFGFRGADREYVRTPFRECYENGGLYCADEVDNGSDSLSAAFNLALSGNRCTFPDGATVPQHPDFRFIATANTAHGATLEFSGRSPLDGAFLDRLAWITWNVDRDFERDLATAYATAACEARGSSMDRPLVDAWIAAVQSARTLAAEAGLSRLTTSPRASIAGAVKLCQGMAWETCAEALVLKGADSDTRERLASAMRRPR